MQFNQTGRSCSLKLQRPTNHFLHWDEFVMLLMVLFFRWENGGMGSGAPEGSCSLCLDFEKINYDNLSLCEKIVNLTSSGKLAGKCLIRTSHCVMVLLSD